MRTNRAAVGIGVLLAVALAVAVPNAHGLAAVDPATAGDPYASHRQIINGDGVVIFNESFSSGPPRQRPDPRPWWQRQWEWVCGPIYPPPERLHGGIM